MVYITEYPHTCYKDQGWVYSNIIYLNETVEGSTCLISKTSLIKKKKKKN